MTIPVRVDFVSATLRNVAAIKRKKLLTNPFSITR